MYLFDTDTLSNLLRRQPSIQLLRRLSGAPVGAQFTSSITVGELYYGIQKSSRTKELREKLGRLVWPRVQVLPFDLEAATVYGRIRSDLEKNGQPLSDPDLMIASIAFARDLTLITGNTRQFEQIEGLRTADWPES
jgi:tRNA(fMet)-specific endonuclease VapC